MVLAEILEVVFDSTYPVWKHSVTSDEATAMPPNKNWMHTSSSLFRHQDGSWYANAIDFFVIYVDHVEGAKLCSHGHVGWNRMRTSCHFL